MPKVYPSITKHFELLEKIQQEKDTEKKKKLCLEDIALLPKFRKELIKQADEGAVESMKMGHLIGEKFPLEYYKEKRKSMYQMPSYPSFKALAIIYEKEGDYLSAIKICKDAIREGFEDDRTKSGMTGRIQKLEKLLSEK